MTATPDAYYSWLATKVASRLPKSAAADLVYQGFVTRKGGFCCFAVVLTAQEKRCVRQPGIRLLESGYPCFRYGTPR
jgi:hypothetical protein